jgi:predicted PhzF superfamily epimerase YddE/YHI9
MIHGFSTGNYVTMCGHPTLASFARYLSHGPPIVYLRLNEQILFLQAKTVSTALALGGKNGKA